MAELGAPLSASLGGDTSGAPIAIVAPAEQDAVIGSVVRVDGSASYSPDGSAISYSWNFTQIPIGSQVESVGFQFIEDDDSIVSFAPDVTGLYIVELVVNDGTFDSIPAISEITTKVVLVPQNLGIVPDLSWVWNFLSDFWTRVDQREKFDTFWSSAIQIIAAEQLKLWQYDYDKSIKDIQELIQKRWLHYDPGLDLDATLTSFILSDDQAGLNAETTTVDQYTLAPISSDKDLSDTILFPATEGEFVTTSYGLKISAGHVLKLNKQAFTFARTGSAVQSVSSDSTGAFVIATDNFNGTGFDPSFVGMYLKLLSGQFAGFILSISSYINATTITVETVTGGPVVFPTAESGISYVIYPKIGNLTSVFTDQKLVPTNLIDIVWRLSPTLVSTQYDFEALGVSPGDTLIFQILRQDNKLSSTINVQVVSVDRGRVGFVYNLDDLIDGTPASGLSRDDQIRLANDLQIPGLLVDITTNELVYTDQALIINSTINSIAFKRSFYEASLTSSTSINVGPFSILLTPLRVIRNSRILIDSSTKAIPSLQEYVKQPVVVEKDGSLFQIAQNKFYPIDNLPYVVYENADYIIDDETGVSGNCATIASSQLITVPFGDLIDRGIAQGDSIVIRDGIVDRTFLIIEIVDGTTIKLATPFPTTIAVTPFSITRDIPGKFIRFIDGVFTKTSPAPKRLWAEVTFFDNEAAVESNFGSLVGVSRADLAVVGSTISYKNAVAGLMYALANGPVIDNLQLASQILLGLPFTVTRGVVTEVDPDFKIRLDGSPELGRILISAQDIHGKSLGTTNIYFYPQGAQREDPLNPGTWLPVNPTLSGLAINPATGVEYVVGDIVEAFASLSKGTSVQDYITNPELVTKAIGQGNFGFALQRYHAFRLVLNADITTAIDTDLVAQFIRKAKPTYVKMELAFSKIFDDEVDITDVFLIKRPILLEDNISLSMPISVSMDAQTLDAAYTTLDGRMWSYRITGDDLVTTYNSYVATSASGGFVTARINESHDNDFLVPGCLVVIHDGINRGHFVIDSVDSDTQITLSSFDENVEDVALATASGQYFTIYRPVDSLVVRGSLDVVTSSAVSTASFGFVSAGIAVGDRLVFTDGSVLSNIYTIINIDIANHFLTFSKVVTEASGTYTCAIVRNGLIPKYIRDDYGVPPPISHLTADEVSGSNALTINIGASADLPSSLLIQPDDILTNIETAEVFEVIDVDPSTNQIYVQPAASNTAEYDFLIERPSRSSSKFLSMDVIDRMPEDSLFLSIKNRAIVDGGFGPDLTTTNGSSTVSTVSGVDFWTDLGVMAGDYVVVLEGADSTVDVGYGNGIYPILQVSGTNLVLTRNLTETDIAPGILYGIQRRRPNER